MSSPDAPKITVLTSVYNAAAFVEESLRSILTQTFTDFEFILIDDGSNDGSSAIVDRLAAADSRLRVIHQDNVGLTKSLNRGLALARGEFVARHDADDVSLPERLRVQWNFLTDHPAYSVVGCWYDRVDATGRVIKRVRTRKSDFRIRLRLLDGNPIPHPGALLRLADVRRCGGYERGDPRKQPGHAEARGPGQAQESAPGVGSTPHSRGPDRGSEEARSGRL